MEFQASFLSDSVKISMKNGNYICALGYITYYLSIGDWDGFEKFFPYENKEKLKNEALAALEKCFPEKDNMKKIEAFMQCEEELKLGKGYLMSESHPVVMPDGSVGMADTYWLNSLSAFILLEMMYCIRYNIPIVKCPICSKFFIATNNGIQYCDRIYKNGKTCRQIGAKKYFTEKLKSDKLLLQYEKTYQSIYYKRSKTTDEALKSELSKRLTFLKNSRTKYKKGEISPDEFIKILEK